MNKLVLAGAMLALSGAANAAILFDNGGPIGGGISNDASAWVQANDFSLAAASTVTGGAIYIEAQGQNEIWDGTLDYYFFSDNAGKPGTLLVTGSAINKILTDTGITDQAGNGTIKRVDFELASGFGASASTVYWFGVHLANNFGFYTSAALSAAGYGNETESLNATFDNWNVNGREGAFLLNGNGGLPTELPEPASLALLGLGLVGLGFSRRKH